MSSLIVINNENLSVAVAPGFSELREAALIKGALIGVVTSQEQSDAADSVLRDIGALIRDVEKARVTVKQPVLDLCRKIDSTAAAAVEELKAEQLRLNQSVGEYKQELLAKAREENRRREEELQRIEEQRLAEEREAQRKAAEEQAKRDAERRRIEAEEKRIRDEAAKKAQAEREAEERKQRELAAEAAKAKGAKEKAEFEAKKAAMDAERKIQDERRAAEEKARLEQAAKEKARLDKENAEAQAKLEAEQKAAAERAAQDREAVGGPSIVKGAKEVLDYEVTDVHKLAKMHPALVKIEPCRADILELINGGVKEIAGIRIISKVKNTAASGRSSTSKLIEV